MVRRNRMVRRQRLRGRTLLSAFKRLIGSNDRSNETIWLSSGRITVAQVRRDKLKTLSGK